MPHIFLDSGAFTMAGKARKKSLASEKGFYKTKVFWSYVDAYANFIKKHKSQFDAYANVDTSRFPKITWDVQKYLENEHGLTPLPVIHHGESMKWIEKYLNAGYTYICMGGVAKTKGYTPSGRFYSWGDTAWRLLCPGPSFVPTVKVHGFAITSIPLMQRYPWYSVDSVTWKKMSYYGQILVPPKTRVGYDFTVTPYVIFMDDESKYTTRKGNTGRHLKSFPKGFQHGVKEWLELIEVPWGRRSGDGSIIELGATNDSHHRCSANIRYFEMLAKAMPKWPWRFKVTHRPTLSEALEQ